MYPSMYPQEPTQPEKPEEQQAPLLQSQYFKKTVYNYESTISKEKGKEIEEGVDNVLSQWQGGGKEADSGVDKSGDLGVSIWLGNEII